MNYEFTKDGTYRVQQSSLSKNMMESTYEIKGDTIRLFTKMMDLKVKELTDDKMVTNFFVDQHFKRGECS